MCGICGYRSEINVPLEKMINVLAHRGPDDSGVFRHETVGLGHCRLSIIDVVHGCQPMKSEDGKVIIVYNGEIYNFLELRKNLVEQGVNFRTFSDTEVLLSLYQCYGTKMLSYLNGMFAFVIYDQRKNSFFGARDRLGIKPLYYHVNKNGFFFASEIKALLATGLIQPKGNPMAADLYFTYRYIPGNNTIYDGIYKVLPGCAFEQEGAKPPRFWQYWDIPDEQTNKKISAAIDEFNEILLQSVRYQLISDVPLGVFLSGGVDSTTIVSMMSRLNHQPINSFTVGFDNDYDEINEAQHTAKYLNCQNDSVIAHPEDFQLLPKIIWHMDEPFGDQILLPMYLLSRFAAKSVKVVLSGEGADEGQMGYIHHEALSKGIAVANYFSSHGLSLLAALTRKIPINLLDLAFNYPGSLGPKGRERLALLFSSLNSPGKSYQLLSSVFLEEERENLYGPVFKRGLQQAKEEFQQPMIEAMDKSSDPLREIYKHDLKNWLPNNILNKLDRMTMANSLEGRVPFLDHRLVEFEACLPQHFKIKHGKGKYLLRKLFEERYDIAGRKTRKKQAFFMSLEGQYQQTFQDLKREYLNPDKIDEQLLNPLTVTKIAERAEMSPLLGHKQVMSIIMFIIWTEVFKPRWN